MSAWLQNGTFPEQPHFDMGNLGGYSVNIFKIVGSALYKKQ